MKKTRRMLVSVGTILVLMGGLVIAAEELGPELIANGDMEKDSNWESFQIGSSTLPKVNEQSFTEKHNGKASRHVVIATGSKEYPGIKSAPVFATVTGKTYRVNFWIKVVKGGAVCSMRNGASNNYLRLRKEAINNPNWKEYTLYYAEKDGGNRAWLCFMGSKGETEFYLDDVSVKEVMESGEGYI